MDCKELQLKNTSIPILVTVDGIFIVCKELHSRKAKLLILFTEDGMSIDCKDLQSQNACLPILVTEDGIIKFFGFVKQEINFFMSDVYKFSSYILKLEELQETFILHPTKGFPPILVTENGILMDCKDLQP
jgi:hypothetical protein